MAKRINIQLGDRIRYQGRDFDFIGMIPPEGSGDGADIADDLQLRDIRDGRIKAITQVDFDRAYGACEILWSNPKARKSPAPDLAPSDCGNCGSCKSCEKEHSYRAVVGLMEAFDAEPVSKTDVALQCFLDSHATTWPAAAGKIPKAARFRVMLRECGAPGDRRPGDVRRFKIGSVRRNPKIDPRAEEVLWRHAERLWSDPTMSIKVVYAAVHSELAETNRDRLCKGFNKVKVPSYSTVRRMIIAHTDYDKSRQRYGARVAGRTFKPLKGSLKATRLLEVVVMDHTWMDCHVVDDDTFMPVGRPYLTLAIDVRSRYPLSYVLGFTPPSVETAMGCIRRAVRPKDDLNARHPDVLPWEVFGKPETIVVDNGWEFVGSSFQDACHDAGIAVTWAPVRTPEYKGIVERFFRTLKDLMRGIQGSTPFSIAQLRELGLDPSTKAVLLLSQLDELVHQCIVEVYGRSFHSGIKAVPEQVWKQRQSIDGIRYVEDLRAFDMASGRLGGTRSLDRRGVQFLGLTYSSEAVFDILNRNIPVAPKRGHRYGSIKAKFKYWPEDISKIAVWDEVLREYVELACTQPEYANGLGEHHHQQCEKFARANGLEFSSLEDRCAALTRFTEKSHSLARESGLAARRRAQRLKRLPMPDLPAVVDAEDFHIPVETHIHRAEGTNYVPGPNRKKKPATHHAAQRKGRSAQSEKASAGLDVFKDIDLTALAQAFEKGHA